MESVDGPPIRMRIWSLIQTSSLTPLYSCPGPTRIAIMYVRLCSQRVSPEWAFLSGIVNSYSRPFPAVQ